MSIIIIANNNHIYKKLDNYVYLDETNYRYNNYVFEYKDWVIYEKVEEVKFIDSDFKIYKEENNKIVIPYYSNNFYIKLAFFLYLMGYTNIFILDLYLTEPENFLNDDSIHESVFNVIDTFNSENFYNFVTNKYGDFNLLYTENPDKCLTRKIQRIKYPSFEGLDMGEEYILYDMISNDQNNKKLLESYYILYKLNENISDYLLSPNYRFINSSEIDEKFIDSCCYDFVKENINKENLPINLNDFNKLYNYYKFEPSFYKEMLSIAKFDNYDNKKLFIYFLIKEKNKFIFDFPNGFKLENYIYLNPDLKVLENNYNIMRHFLQTGRSENREIFPDLPYGFDWKLYEELNDLNFKNKYEAEYHYISFGKKSNFLTGDILSTGFDSENYLKLYPELKGKTRKELIQHYLREVKSESFRSLLPSTFNVKNYIKANPDLKNLENKSDKEIINHFINYGIFENRMLECKKIYHNIRILGICHVGNRKVFEKMEFYVNNLLSIDSQEVNITLFLNIIEDLSLEDKGYIIKKYSNLKNVKIITIKNFGFDMGSFFNTLDICKEENLEFDYVIKLHTKTDDQEREKLIKPLLGSINRIKIILDILKQENIGLVGSKQCLRYNHDMIAKHNLNHMIYLLKKFGMKMQFFLTVQFVGGTIFWIKFNILKNIFFNHDIKNLMAELNDINSFDWNWYLIANSQYIHDKKINTKELAEEHYINYGSKNSLSPNLFHAIKYRTKSHALRDGMIEHAYERFFSYAIIEYGMEQYFITDNNLLDEFNIRPMPIIFPQFHNIPENDKFWGENFTEWTLLKKVDNDYMGNRLIKPHKDLGYYNILDEKYIDFTQKLFKKYNINFVCYYHYWFCGKKVMYKPVENVRNKSRPNINYCLAWANETWSSRWDGLENEILIKQEYGNEKDWKKHIDYLITFFNDIKYIKIDNMPLFFIYRPLEIEPKVFENMTKYFRKTVKNNTIFKDLMIIVFYNNTSNLSLYDNYNKLVDGVMDFNPNYTNTCCFGDYQIKDENCLIFNKDKNGNIIYDEDTYLAYNLDVRKEVQEKRLKSGFDHYNNIIEKEKKTRLYKSNVGDTMTCFEKIISEKRKHDLQLYSIFLGWNNTPRRDITKKGLKPTIFTGFNPFLYKKYLRELILKVIKDPNENKNINYIIINAWNEWNEQTCLEPSDIYGYQMLEITSELFSDYY